MLGVRCVAFPLILVAALLAARGANATALLANGDFEQGLSGWMEGGIPFFGVDGLQFVSPLSEWHAYDNDGAPWNDNPAGIQPAGGAGMASYYADGPELGILYQAFTVPSAGATVQVAFDFFTPVAGTDSWLACGFDMDCAAALPLGSLESLFRVDLVRADVDPFSTLPGEHLPLLDGTSSYAFPALPLPYLHVELDVSAFVAAGGEYALRFAGYADDVIHVDNASVELVPEPSTGGLVGVGVLVALLARGGRRGRRER